MKIKESNIISKKRRELLKEIGKELVSSVKACKVVMCLPAREYLKVWFDASDVIRKNVRYNDAEKVLVFIEKGLHKLGKNRSNRIIVHLSLYLSSNLAYSHLDWINRTHHLKKGAISGTSERELIKLLKITLNRWGDPKFRKEAFFNKMGIVPIGEPLKMCTYCGSYETKSNLRRIEQYDNICKKCEQIKEIKK